MALTALGCGGGEEVVLSSGGFAAEIIKLEPDQDAVYAWIWGDPLPDPADCEAYINSAPIDSSFFWYQAGFVYMGVLYSGLGIDPGTICEFHLEVGDLGATGTEHMPDTISFVGDLGPGDTLPAGEDAQLAWSGGADFYDGLVVVYLFDSDRDTMATRYLSDYIRNTTWLIPGDSLLSPHPAWAWSEVWVDVDPVNGPFPSPCQASNCKGELPGFFFAANYLGSPWVFYVGSPGRVAGGPPPAKEPRVPGVPWP